MFSFYLIKRGYEDIYFIMLVNVIIYNNLGRVFFLILKKYIIRLNEVNKKNVKKKEIFLKLVFKKMKKFLKNYY